MYNEGNPEIFADQGLYYPPAANFGYYCTGFESPVEWEDQHRVLGLDGPEIQYAGAQTESSQPYVYYTPGYGYPQSPYNPYNPYIPGAMIGIDGPYVGAQQYYSIPPYQDPVSSPGYIPFIVQPDISANGTTDSLLDNGVAFANRPDGRSLKHGLASSSAAFPRNASKFSSNQNNSLTKTAEGPRANVGPSKQSITSFSVPPSSHVHQNRSASGSIQSIDNLSNVKVLSQRNQLKVAVPMNTGFSDFGSNAYGQTGVDKLRSKIYSGRNMNDMHGSPDVFDEQNRGPRTSKSKTQLAVKAYTTKVGNSNAQGNIIIYTDQYNKNDFSVEYVNAKFFVIKSYSEDDVHKSIKYNVWSSTPHGNKKLQIAYEDAQKIAAAKPGGCPIFLFFSVNASGQFCGVAEMIDPVDFHKDMDFWQQDKWSGSFPVKWHIIKDVPNTSFRHIILENNENKPVTNSRDTQEIMFKEGLEMLKIFKNYSLKTSLLDDFIYYENRQKIMHEEKAIYKSFESPLVVPSLDPIDKLNRLVERAPNKDEKILEHNGSSSVKKIETSPVEQVLSNSDVSNSRNEVNEEATVKLEDDATSALRICSLSINLMQPDSKTKPITNAATSDVKTEPVDVVTVGSVPVKVNGFSETSSFLTVGSIPLDPKALQIEKGGASGKKHESQN